ncbi:MAG: hypothetical protein JWN03_879 [Nocardia sp.]|uniref:hypothetical protein n=1 Tax=Nocardia sp. TaxID=1821 RepID=UPI002628F6DC|nr:hypothetical protein [Nocardia sp.]MCU1640604.1 hypothetical protein [Nocardia sp.]
MSHQHATPAARTSRRAAQVLRFSAVVTAGMASIGLTVAAGSYVANEMAGTQKSGTMTAAPSLAHGQFPPPVAGSGNPLPGSIAPIADNIGLTSLFMPRKAETVGLEPIPAVTPGESAAAPASGQRPNALAGQIRLGNTYVGAAVLPAQLNSVSVTLDTNVFATLADLVLHSPLGRQLGIDSDPSANTQLRTDVDTRRGDVTVTFSDPALGRYGVQFAPNTAPAPADSDTVTAEPTQPAAADPATVGETAGGRTSARTGTLTPDRDSHTATV